MSKNKEKQGFFHRLKKFWESLGPGLVTGASDDDPSGILTYTQAGTSFGFNTLWTAFLTLPLMTTIQEMCARVGLATKQGLFKVLKMHYPKWLVLAVAMISIPAMILNIAADLSAMGGVMTLFFPQVPAYIFTIIISGLIIPLSILWSYKRLESVLKWLALVLLVYLIVPFFTKINVFEVIQSVFIPKIEFTPEYINILVAILGTTISPYLFFWETSMEVENVKAHHVKPSQKLLKAVRADNIVGMLLSNVIMFFIILTAAGTLFSSGENKIDTLVDAANSLRPLAGDLSYYLFALGIIGTGFLAVPVLAGATAYVVSEGLGIKEGINKKWYEAKGFYSIFSISVIIGLIINFLNINPVEVLLWSAVFYGIISPPLIAVLLHLSNRKEIMGEFKNGRISNILGTTCLVIMSLAVVAMIWVNFF